MFLCGIYLIRFDRRWPLCRFSGFIIKFLRFDNILGRIWGLNFLFWTERGFIIIFFWISLSQLYFSPYRLFWCLESLFFNQISSFLKCNTCGFNIIIGVWALLLDLLEVLLCLSNVGFQEIRWLANHYVYFWLLQCFETLRRRLFCKFIHLSL